MVRDRQTDVCVCVCVFEILGGELRGLVSPALGCGFLGINASLFPIPAIAIGPTMGVCTCDS